MTTSTLVVGASGKNGRAAVEELLRRGERVLAATRAPGKLDQRGALAVQFDWELPETYSAAAALGVDRVYLIVPEQLQDGPERAGELLRRMVGRGLRRVVTLSAMGVESYPGHPLAEVDRTVRELAPEWAVLKPNWFMQNFTEGIFRGNLLEHGLIRAPGDGARISFVDVADIGACAAAALTRGPGKSATFELTGPEALTFAEAADHFARVTGRPVRYEPLAPDDPELVAKLGLPPMDPAPVRALFERVVAGEEARVTTGVADLLGREPAGFGAFAARCTPLVTAG